MTRLKTFTILAAASLTLAGCMSERSMGGDTTAGVFLIEHTGPGTVYWK